MIPPQLVPFDVNRDLESLELLFEWIRQMREQLWQVDQALDALHEQIKVLLRQAGWHYSCNWPGSEWRWSKSFKPGGQISFDSYMDAFEFEKNALEHNWQHNH